MRRPTPREARLADLRKTLSPPPSPSLLKAVAPCVERFLGAMKPRQAYYLAEVRGGQPHLVLWANAPGPLVRVAEGHGGRPGLPLGRPSVLIIAGGECGWLTLDALKALAPKEARP